MGIPHYLTCLLRNLYAGQEAAIRIGHGTTDYLKLGKEYNKVVYCCLVYLTYIEYIMQIPRLNESQAGIKIARRNINNLRYADNTTLKAESEEELKVLLMKVKKESEKDGLKFNIQNAKIMASSSISSWHIEEEKFEAETFYFLGVPNHCRW